MMKKMMVAGGLAGFSLTTLCGILSDGSAWPDILFRASVAALAGGLLLRWWAGVFVQALAQAHAEREAARAAAKPASPLAAFKR